MFTDVYVNTFIHIDTCVHEQSYKYMYICLYIYHICIWIYMYICTIAHAPRKQMNLRNAKCTSKKARDVCK